MHTAEKERVHKKRENAKTLFGFYKILDGGEPLTDALKMLRATMNHVKKEHIEYCPWQIYCRSYKKGT